MIDYHAEQVALENLVAELGSLNLPDPGTDAARQEALGAVADAPVAALSGALLHQLLAHAASDGAELDLLRRAAALWERGTDLCRRLAAIRDGLESALAAPAAPGAADRFNSAAMAAQVFVNDVSSIRADIEGFRGDTLRYPHLPAHPRQADLGTRDWEWSDLGLGRRTDALVRAFWAKAGDAPSRAFAVGVLASYGANAIGSAYLGQGVGGPRRLHRHRDRLARNAVGSWLVRHHPSATTLATISATLPAEMDDATAGLVNAVLADTFDLAGTPPMPDVRLGHRRMVEHLALLDGFRLPPVPLPPLPTFVESLYSDPQNPPPTLRPQDVDVVGQDGGGVAVSFGGDPQPGSQAPSSSDSSGNTVCGVLVALIIAVDLIQAFVQCVVQWAEKKPCTFWDNMLLKKVWEQDPPDPHDPTQPTPVSVTAQQLTAVADTAQSTQLVGMLYDLHGMVWEAMDKASAFLAVTGLVYPGDKVTGPLYAQFTALPVPSSWPHREEPDPVSTYHRHPISPLENPTAEVPYPRGARPTVTMMPEFGPGAPQLAVGVWRQIVAGEQDTENRDLDADRGLGHPCWAAAGSVLDDPIDVIVLGYGEQ